MGRKRRRGATPLLASPHPHPAPAQGGGTLRRGFATFTALLALALSVAAIAAAAPPQPPRHTETIEVREAGVLVEMPPPQLVDKLRRARRPSDFQLYLDGSPREVVSLEAASSQPWEIVVYLDPALAPAGPLNDTVLLLGQRAERLMALGTVAVVVADPEPRVALSPTRDFSHWPAALAQVAVTAGGRAPGLAAPQLLETVRRQCDRLATFAAHPSENRAAHPRALLWIGAPDLPVTPSETNALTQATDPGREDLPARPESPPIAAAFAKAAQTLAAYGWVTIPVIVQPPPKNAPPPPPPPPGGAALERPRQGPIEGQSGPFSGYREDPKAKARRSSDDLKMNAALYPWLAPHHLLARATAGRVVQDLIQLDDALDSLGRRWWLWYRPPVAADGRLHTLEVRLGGKVSVGSGVKPDLRLGATVHLQGDARRDGQPLPAPVWVRGFTPEKVE